jgi:hypothetical protein
MNAVPAAKPFWDAMAPSTNRALAGFVTPEYLIAAKSDPTVGMKRYLVLQTNRQLEGVRISGADFDREIRDPMRQQGAQISSLMRDVISDSAEEASKNIADVSGLATKFELGEPQVLGIYADETDFIAIGTMMRIQGSVGDRVVDVLMANSSMMMRLQGKLVYAYVYRQVERDEDLVQLAADTRAWGKLLLEANAE